MRFALVFALGFGLVSTAMAAQDLAPRCYVKAEQATETFTQDRSYDEGGISAFQCFASPVGRAVICNVSADKGKGAAADSYQVVLNQSCTRVFRVELTGEE